MPRPVPLSQRVTAIAERLEQFERRVDAQFASVDTRFDAVDQRFDELRRHFDVIAEASRDDFRNLYDLVQAHMARTDTRVDTLARDLRGEMKLGYTALDNRITALERAKPSRTRRR